MDTPAVASFRTASEFFVAAVAHVPPGTYDQRWSDERRVLDVIAHGNRAHSLLVEYFERPVAIAGPDYVLPENIAARARQATRDLGDDRIGVVRAAAERALAVVSAAPNDATVGTPFGIRDLDGYLQSRTAELVIHGLDLGTAVEPPAEALTDYGTFLIGRDYGSGRGCGASPQRPRHPPVRLQRLLTAAAGGSDGPPSAS